MPLKNTVGSLKTLSISTGYTPPDNYWLLKWEYESTGNYYGTECGSYFTTDGKLWLGAIENNTLEVVAIDDYGRFSQAETIVLPTHYTINANAYIDYTFNGTYDYTNISGLDSVPISISKGTQVANTYVTFPFPHWVTTPQDVIYVQRSDGSGTVLPYGNTLNNDWLPQNFSSYSNGYSFSAHSGAITNGVDYSDYLFNYDSSGNLRYVDDFRRSGTTVANQNEVYDLIPLSDNSTFVLLYCHGTITNTPYVPYAYGLVTSLSTTGFLNYSKSLTIGSNALVLNETIIIGTDYYAIGTSNGNCYVVKGSTTDGIVTSAKQLTGVTSVNSIKTGKLYQTEIYITCNNNLNVIQLDLDLNLVYQRQLSTSFSLEVDGVGSMMLIGTFFVFKTPSDGTILGSGSYTVGSTTVTYSTISSIGVSTVTVISTAFTLLTVSRNTTFAGVYSQPSTITDSTVTIQKSSWNT